MITDKNFLDGTYQKVQKGLKQLNAGNPKGLKQFRVAVKRLRAFALLVDYVNRSLKKSSYASITLRQFRTVFKASGGLRDAEMSLKLLESYEKSIGISCDEFRIEVEKGREEYAVRFESSYVRVNKLVFLKVAHSIVESIKSFSKRDLMEITGIWLEEGTREIEAKLKKISSEEDIHDLRKDMKELYFILEIKGVATSDMPKVVKQKMKSIGKWHDLTIFRDEVVAFLEKGEKPVKRYSDYTRLLNRVEREAKNHLRSAQIEFDHFLRNPSSESDKNG